MYYFPKNIITDIINYSNNIENELFLYFLNLKDYNDMIYLLDIEKIIYDNIKSIDKNLINNKKLLILIYLKKLFKNNLKNCTLFIIIIFKNIQIKLNNSIILISISEIINILKEINKEYLIINLENYDNKMQFNNILKVYINNYNKNIFNKINIEYNNLLSNKVTIYKSEISFINTFSI